MESIFFRLLKEDDKGAALRCCIADLCAGRENDLTHTVRQETFALLPGSPIPYWVSDAIRRKFKELPTFEENGGTVKAGLCTGNNFHFVRARWEVPPESIAHSQEETWRSKRWVPFAKGGEYSPYYADVHLVVDWIDAGQPMLAYPGARVQNTDYYFRPGLTYLARTNLTFCARVLPKGCIYGHVGPAIFPKNQQLTPVILALVGSRLIETFLMFTMSRGGEGSTQKAYEVGRVQTLPYPKLELGITRQLGHLGFVCYNLKRDLDRVNETSYAFTRPALLATDEKRINGCETAPIRLSATHPLSKRFLAWLAVQDAAEVRVIENSYQIDQAALDLYEISERDRRTIDRELGPHPGSYPHKDNWSDEDDGKLRQLYLKEIGSNLEKIAHALRMHPASVAARRQALGLYRPADFAEAVANFISYCVGCLSSRWDIRIGAGDLEPPPLLDPEEGLLLYPPGALRPDSPPLQPTGPQTQIIERSAHHGILVDDRGHKQDIVSGVEACLTYLFGEERLPALRAEIEEALGRDLREWLARYFFPFHIKRYSKSRRKAPIYWQLTTPGKGYSLWLYYHALGPETLYTAVREYVAPKIEFEEGRLKELQAKFAQARESGPAREARRLEKAVEDQEAFLQELYAFRSELHRLTDWGYDPDLNDGVIINIAPLHRLVPWKEAAKMWQELEQGKYGWSTMAKRIM